MTEPELRFAWLTALDAWRTFVDDNSRVVWQPDSTEETQPYDSATIARNWELHEAAEAARVAWEAVAFRG